MLDVATASRLVDVRRRRRSSGRLLTDALLVKRLSTAKREAADGVIDAVAKARERERLLAYLESAAAEISAAAAMTSALDTGLRFSNGRGDARRFVGALEACLAHGARGDYGAYLAGAASAASIAVDTGRHAEIAAKLDAVHLAASRATVGNRATKGCFTGNFQLSSL